LAAARRSASVEAFRSSRAPASSSSLDDIGRRYHAPWWSWRLCPAECGAQPIELASRLPFGWWHGGCERMRLVAAVDASPSSSAGTVLS
jgi:hypothetical protein